MADYELPRAPQVEDAYRAAYRAIQALVGKYRVTQEECLDVSEVILLLPGVIEEAEMAAAAQLGPLIHWQAPPREGDWELIVAGVDLDGEGREFGVPEFGESAFEGPGGRWHGCSLDKAARAYSREAGWDFAPDEAGIWLLMIAPVSASGGEARWFYSGHLAGFVIVHDRNKDGDYESVAHIWTAATWRRHGVARRLMAEARTRFPITGVEGPYSADGAAFLDACPAA